MNTLLPNYDPKISVPFNFRISTTKETTLQAAENLFQLLGVSTGKKDHLKKRFIATLLLNLKLSLYNGHMLAISLRPEFYAKYHKRYRPAIKTYDTVKKVIHALATQGFIQLVRGIKNPGHKKGLQTKIAPNERVMAYLEDSSMKDIQFNPLKECIVLRNRGKLKNEIDYEDNSYTKEWRKDLKRYNDLRMMSEITLKGVTLEQYEAHKTFFIKYSDIEKNHLSELTENNLSVIPLKTTFVERIFCGDFSKGGRFYGGSEQQIKALRKLIHINGEPTVELDYSSYHIRMLYHLRKRILKGNAYENLSAGDPVMYDLYKKLALTCINCNDLNKCLKAIRKYIIDKKNQDKFPNLKDDTLKVYIDKLLKEHSKIKDDFFQDKGVLLQNIDSKITNNILKHFYQKPDPVLVLSIHDSFILAAGHKDELKEIMEKEYYKMFKKYPDIK